MPDIVARQRRSAELYDFSTETLFAGCQDVMQRTALLPIAEWLSDQLLLPEDVCLLEVGCGTGRFHTHVKVRTSAGW